MQSIGCEDARYGESEATGEDEDSCNGKAIGNAACTRMYLYIWSCDIGIPMVGSIRDSGVCRALCLVRCETGQLSTQITLCIN